MMKLSRCVVNITVKCLFLTSLRQAGNWTVIVIIRGNDKVDNNGIIDVHGCKAYN